MWTLFFKLAGALVIVACGWLAGSGGASSLRTKRMFYEDMIELCELLQNNVAYQRDPLPVFFARETQGRQFSVLRFDTRGLEEFASWRTRFLSDTLARLSLSPHEQSVFHEFFLGLGNGSAQEECGRLHYYGALFASAQEEARKKERECARLYRSLGVCAGLTAAILLF
ncbi:stage III sporulation protein AB [Anaerofilum hominis]|nr:stage III sporulation protein AB [Anaerofilum hominis]